MFDIVKIRGEKHDVKITYILHYENNNPKRSTYRFQESHYIESFHMKNTQVASHYMKINHMENHYMKSNYMKSL